MPIISTVHWHSYIVTVYRTQKDVFQKVPVLRLRGRVPDSWHFGTDPDPRIHTFDYRIRIRILLFSSVAFKTPTKNNFVCLFLIYIILRRSKVVKKSENSRNQDFLSLMEGSGSVRINYGSGSRPRMPKSIRIRIRNAAQRAKEKKLRILGYLLNDTKTFETSCTG